MGNKEKRKRKQKKNENKPSATSTQKIILHEIDNDKLADAIVKANNKQQDDYSPSREWVKFILTPIFWGISVITGFLSIAMFVSLCQNANEIFEKFTATNIVILLIKFLITFFTIGFCVISFVGAREIEKEKDRDYVVAVFSGIVSFAALIVALVALFKGVG